VSLETIYIVICVVANVVLKLVLTPWLGPIGTVLSSAGSWALGSIIFVIMLHQAVELPNTALRATAMLPMMAITILITREAATFMPASTTRWHAALAGAEIGLFSIVLFVVLLAATRILPWATLRRVGAELRVLILTRLGARYAF
jgi:peptidoglycan biosynthesis protein MviN/MurJ (putative lipid II flippase)